MRNSETGEFELVVGNRQLLSGFFIVVLLFAVAFAMGYVVGQNSPHSAKAGTETAAAASPPEPRPQPAASAPEQPKTEPAPAPADTAAEPAPSEPVPPQPTTQPAPAPQTPTAAGDIPVLAELPGPAGSFWQVIALAQPDAEVIAGALKKKGFPVFLSPGTKNLMRVMVGPYSDTAAMGKAKTDLASAGFANPFRK